MPALDLPFRTAKQLAAAIRSKKIGCLELLELYLKRVEAHNPKLNAIIATDLDGARKRARAADAALKRGKPWGPLHGVPMTIKESYDVAGLPTTWGDPNFKDNVAKADSLAVERLKAAGVVLFGKTNVPLMLADWQTFNAIHGTTNNPWDVTRGAGGSSGGSAAALAAGLTGIEARTSAPRSATPRITAASTATSRPTGSPARGATRCPAASRSPTSPRSARSRAAPTISPSRSTRWRGPMRSTGEAGSWRCRAPSGPDCASSRSR